MLDVLLVRHSREFALSLLSPISSRLQGRR